MSFNLEVEFSGLCLFVVHTSRDQVAVLMPDARRLPGQDPGFHLDGEPADPHVGYIRFNLAHLAEAAAFDPPIPEGVDTPNRGAPEYELIHRFSRQVLEFGAALKPAAMGLALNVPDFGAFAPDVQLLPNLFASVPEDALLMRTILRGGDLNPVRVPTPFEIPGPFGGRDYKGFFVNAIRWTRPVHEDALTVRITDLGSNPDGAAQAAFTLRPTASGGTVKLKVANLCERNPVDWEELRDRPASQADLDFKWLYRLFEPKNNMTWKELIDKSPEKALPVPHLRAPLFSGASDCVPATTMKAF